MMLECELAESLEPIRKMFLAQVIHSLFETGIFDILKDNSTKNVNDLSDLSETSPYRLEGVLLYLENEGFVEFNDDRVPYLSETGKGLEASKPWYQLLVGGYGKTLMDLPSLLRDRERYGTRVGELVGQGSCGISQFDALPMTKELIYSIGIPPECIVDIGCGDGSYIVDLCSAFPSAKAIGIEPDEPSARVAKELIENQDLAERVTIMQGDFELIADLDLIPKDTVFIVAFVLQEVLEQSGRGKIIETLQRLKTRYLSGKVVVIEVDRADQNKAKMTSDLGLGYYNPYFLIHRLTEQKLERPDFWCEIFSEAGWEISKQVHPDPSYDPLKLKIGFLLH